MRRRRHKLEVSTFPFLAVLLCAMGSLILMLLVLDRRAKAAARERAQRAAKQVAAEEVRIAEERKQGWEKRREALHAELVGEDQELTGKIAAVERRIASARTDLAAEEQGQKSKRDQLVDEQRRIAILEEEIRGRREETVRAEEQAQNSGQERRRLSAELRSLEQTLDELKALRQKQQQTYSVVPYRGRRGDNRAPIYLECAPSGLVFHPDKKTITALRNSEDIKAEVERRIAQQRAALTAAGRTPDATPYLLMLVRPDGIVTYYQTLKSLRGLELDFGYELIDADWVLEFPAEGEPAKQQPWMVVEKQAPVKAGPAVPMPQRAPVGVRLGGTEDKRKSQSEAGSGAQPSGGPNARDIATARTTAGSADDAGPWQAASAGGGPSGGELPGSGSKVGPTSFGQGAAGAPAALGSPQASGRSAGVVFGGPPDQDGASAGSGPGFGSLGGDNQPGNIGQGQPIIGAGIRAGSPGVARPVEGDAAGLSQLATNRTADNTSGTGTVSPASRAAATPSGTFHARTTSPDGTGQSGAGGGQDSVAGMPHSPTPIPTSGPSGGRGTDSQAGDAAGAASSDKPPSRAAANRSGTAGSAPANGGQRAPLQAFDDGVAKPKKPTRRPEVRPAILGGDRDYVILIECRASAVVLYPFGTSFSAESLAPNNGGGTLLQEAVGRLIARRQATVRPGEQPYRPQVRFLVRPDGLLSMHRAYPVLQGLHIPLSRQNLEADEEVNLSDY
jgi:hypothetical protein